MSRRPNEPQDLDALFAEHEAESAAEAARELAAEQAAWNALPQEERDRITAEREARLAGMFDAAAEADDDADEGDDEDEQEDDE